LRYFFEISYKGTNYHGWQIQQNAVSVQQVIHEKLKQLLNTEIEVTGSGRTDTGVHASQQFFHADFDEEKDPENFKYQLNAVLPKDILVRSVRKVIPEAHARFDALSRSYDYIIIPQRDPFLQGSAMVYLRELDLDLLNEAAQILIGKKNFESFSKVKTQVNHFNCEITEAVWSQKSEKIIFHIRADRFLRGMVRAIVGTLLMVNEGKIKPQEIHEILAGRDRASAGRSVPPEGLYLSEIKYPDYIFEI